MQAAMPLLETHEPRKQNEMNRLLRVSAPYAGNMAKNKQKGKKQKNVFQVANKHLKHKNKAKPVTTALKHVRLEKFLIWYVNTGANFEYLHSIYS